MSTRKKSKSSKAAKSTKHTKSTTGAKAKSSKSSKPPHPIIRPTEPYRTSDRTHDIINAAQSTSLNPRNKEDDWYASHHHTLSALVDFAIDEGSLFVRQQFDLWLSKVTLDLRKLSETARQEALRRADSVDGWSVGENNSKDEQDDVEEDEDESDFFAALNPQHLGGSPREHDNTRIGEDLEHGSTDQHDIGNVQPDDDSQELDDGHADSDGRWEDPPAPTDNKGEGGKVDVDESEDIVEDGHQADVEAIDTEGEAEDGRVDDDAPENLDARVSLTNAQHPADHIKEGANHVSQGLLIHGDDDTSQGDVQDQGGVNHGHNDDHDLPAPRKSKRGRTLKPIRPVDRLPSAFLSDATRTALANKVRFTQRDEEQAMENMVQLERTAKRLTDACEADESFASAHTTHDSKATNLFPDMIVTHIHTVTKPEPESEEDKQAWSLRRGRKARHNCVVIIEEIKTPPSRKARGDHFKTLLKDRLEAAQEQVFDYARSYFERDRFAETVITMAAAGPYWQWIKATRKQCYLQSAKAGKKARTITTITIAFINRFAAAPIFVLGTPESDAELTKMRNTALIPILEKHLWYPIQLQHRDSETKDGGVQV